MHSKILLSSKKRILYIALISLAVNTLYALGNFALGIWGQSYWFLTMGAYNVILAIMRFFVLLCNKQNQKGISGSFVQRFTGIMIILLACILGGSVYLSVRFDVARSFHEIIMITIAAYTFTKIIIAVINYVKRNKFSSYIIVSLRGIALCDAAASIYSMQKSMLVSFEGADISEIRLMNILTGIGVVVIVGVLGVLMIKNSKKEIKNYEIQNSKRCSENF